MNNALCIVGLGNPGQNYENTRHNFGFMLADALVEACREHGDIQPLSGNKKATAWKCRPGNGVNNTWIIAKPQTYMNKSGEAVIPLLGFYQIPLSRLLVVHDELDLPLGHMRLKLGGGIAGHNGLRSIRDLAGSPDFYRLRLGVGKPAGYDAASFVLSRFGSAESTIVNEVLAAAVKGVYHFENAPLSSAQQFINSFTLPSS